MSGGAFMSDGVWRDRKFVELASAVKFDARLAWFYICCGPHTAAARCGLYRFEPEQMAADLGWPLDDARLAMQCMTERGMASYNREQGLLFVARFLDHNKPNSTKNMRGWRPHAVTCSPGMIRNAWLAALKIHCEARGEKFIAEYGKSFADLESDLTKVEHLPAANAALHMQSAAVQDVKRRPRRMSEIAVSGEALTAAAELRAHVAQCVERSIGKGVLHGWAVHIDRILKRDGRNIEQVMAVIHGLPKDAFWRNVIQSGSGLRKNFDKAYVSIVKNGNAAGGDPFAGLE